MKPLILYLLNNIIKNSEIKYNDVSIKNKIYECISSNNLSEAELLINSCKKLCNFDLEIYSMKSIICIFKNDFNTAEKFLKSGLELYFNNFDLNYNLAYLYEITNNYDLAIKYYGIALNNTKSSDVKLEIKSLIKKLI